MSCSIPGRQTEALPLTPKLAQIAFGHCLQTVVVCAPFAPLGKGVQSAVEHEQHSEVRPEEMVLDDLLHSFGIERSLPMLPRRTIIIRGARIAKTTIA